MEYQYEVTQEVGQTKRRVRGMKITGQGDSLVKWLFIFNSCRHTPL